MTTHLAAASSLQPVFDGSKWIAGPPNGAYSEAHELSHRASQLREVSLIGQLIDVDKHATRSNAGRHAGQQLFVDLG